MREIRAVRQYDASSYPVKKKYSCDCRPTQLCSLQTRDYSLCILSGCASNTIRPMLEPAIFPLTVSIKERRHGRNCKHAGLQHIHEPSIADSAWLSPAESNHCSRLNPSA